MSSGFYALTNHWVMQRRLRRLASYARLNREEGERLICQADEIVVEGVEGCFRSNRFGYLFLVDGLAFYFESKDRVAVDEGRLISVKRPELPT